jgi:hypothetical protein
MAQIVKLRRSSVIGKKPTNAQLELGELSINTADGKVYFAKSGSQGPSIEELVSTNTVNTGSIFLTGNVTASNFSGSFVGDGTGLYNVPASGVTGLQLNQIIDGNVSASILDGSGLQINTDTSITGSLIVDGTLVLSGSIMDHSGSLGQQNYFLTSDGTNVFWALNESGAGKAYFKTQTFDTPSDTWVFNHKLGEKYPIINVYNEFGDQEIPSDITVNDDSTATITFSSEQTGYVSATIGGLFRTFDITSLSTGWTINHNFGEDNPLVTVYDENDSVILPSEIQSIDNSTNTLTVTFNNIQKIGKVSVAGSGTSFKKTQTTPLNTWIINHNLGELYPIVQVYDINDKVVIPYAITSYDKNTIFVSFNSPQIGTVHVTVGGANLTPTIDNNYQGYVLATDGTSSYWKGGILSGSAGVSQLGFATTGSNTFYGTQTFSGSIIPADSSYSLGSPTNPWGDIHVSSGSIYIGETAKMGTVSQVVSNSVTLIDLGVYDGANFDYIVKNGMNMRGGNIAAVWNGSNSSHNEINTTDLGNTSPVEFSVSNDGKLNVSVSSGTWTIEIIYRALG